ncbi:lytic polysaccharide monooxygenase [Krasilnikovia sp. MM14-A1004]|uniref:lytic polysaccharide monooxygenase auxiliary activity family 9 protein n=1 Tax=Krasilnikovia sp. MM14-A1004 TaxID=3373541 RepID=UPI00399C70EF
MKRQLFAYGAAALLAATVGVLAWPGSASAHGAMMAPGSRTYLCWKDGLSANGQIQPKNPACAAAVAQSGVTSLYNWFAVLRSDGGGRMAGFIPDGQLCSGGTGGPYDFTGYNLARDDWPVTHLSSGATMQFSYNDWAKHPGTFALYLTKVSWNPTRPLAWSDLESTPFSRVVNPPAQGGPGTEDGHYYWTGTLPSGKSGRHLVYSVWSRSDSQETFYGCSDVVFDGGHGEVTGVGDGTTPPPTTPPTTPPTDPPAGDGCSAMYATTGAWNGGFQGEVMVHAATTPVNGWTVSWTFPSGQRITQLWNGRAGTNGSAVTVANESYNAAIAVGGHTTFGFLGSGTAPTSLPDLTCRTP